MQERWLGQDVENWRPPHFDQLGPVDPSRLPSAWALPPADESDDDGSAGAASPRDAPASPAPASPPGAAAAAQPSPAAPMSPGLKRQLALFKELEFSEPGPRQSISPLQPAPAAASPRGAADSTSPSPLDLDHLADSDSGSGSGSGSDSYSDSGGESDSDSGGGAAARTPRAEGMKVGERIEYFFEIEHNGRVVESQSDWFGGVVKARGEERGHFMLHFDDGEKLEMEGLADSYGIKWKREGDKSRRPARRGAAQARRGNGQGDEEGSDEGDYSEDEGPLSRRRRRKRKAVAMYDPQLESSRPQLAPGKQPRANPPKRPRSDSDSESDDDGEMSDGEWFASLDEGSKLEARDERSREWYPAKVVGAEGGAGPSRRVRVHYVGWNATFDFWAGESSSRVRRRRRGKRRRLVSKPLVTC